MSTDFFEKIKGFSTFADLTDAANYQAAPKDWVLIIADVKNSTVAIQNNRYKDVNLAGASAITALLNAVGRVDIPYVFGGDGMTALVPPNFIDAACQELSYLQNKIMHIFGLHLRVGYVTIGDIEHEGGSVLVSRFALSDTQSQAVFLGNGLSIAEHDLKNAGRFTTSLMPDATREPDLTGLECRWSPIESTSGNVLSILIKAAGPQGQSHQTNIYRSILSTFDQILGSEKNHSPVTVAAMRFNITPRALYKESVVRAELHTLGRLRYLMKASLLSLIGAVCMKWGLKVGTFDGATYLHDLVRNSDARKFDEALRMVIDCSDEEMSQIEACLSSYAEEKKIVYGVHRSASALMTCMVFDLKGRHIHFVDGSDGGYALAGLKMKQMMKK